MACTLRRDICFLTDVKLRTISVHQMLQKVLTCFTVKLISKVFVCLFVCARV